MADSRRRIYKALLTLLMVNAASGAYQYRLEPRQNNPCANHASGVFVANPLDCHLFYLCAENGKAITASCPLHLVFNPNAQLCDTSVNVQCKQPSATTAPTTTATHLPTASEYITAQRYCLTTYDQQHSPDYLAFLAHPTKCNQYYICYYGQALLQACSTDLQWNSRTEKCDLPRNAKCQAKGEISVPPAIANGLVCPVYGQHIFPHIEHCSRFIYCVKGHAILQQCPFYKHFDVRSSRCKWLKQALCIKQFNLEKRTLHTNKRVL